MTGQLPAGHEVSRSGTELGLRRLGSHPAVLTVFRITALGLLLVMVGQVDVPGYLAPAIGGIARALGVTGAFVLSIALVLSLVLRHPFLLLLREPGALRSAVLLSFVLVILIAVLLGRSVAPPWSYYLTGGFAAFIVGTALCGAYSYAKDAWTGSPGIPLIRLRRWLPFSVASVCVFALVSWRATADGWTLLPLFAITTGLYFGAGLLLSRSAARLCTKILENPYFARTPVWVRLGLIALLVTVTAFRVYSTAIFLLHSGSRLGFAVAVLSFLLTVTLTIALIWLYRRRIRGMLVGARDRLLGGMFGLALLSAVLVNGILGIFADDSIAALGERSTWLGFIIVVVWLLEYILDLGDSSKSTHRERRLALSCLLLSLFVVSLSAIPVLSITESVQLSSMSVFADRADLFQFLHTAEVFGVITGLTLAVGAGLLWVANRKGLREWRLEHEVARLAKENAGLVQLDASITAALLARQTRLEEALGKRLDLLQRERENRVKSAAVSGELAALRYSPW